MYDLKDKNAIITGGSGGIGRSTAKLMLEYGARVLLVDIDGDGLKEAKAELNHDRLETLVADVSKENEVAQYAARAEELFPQIDICFNNAGVEGVVAPLEDYPLEVFDQVININIKGVYYGLRHVMPKMKEKGGSVIITSSVAGMEGTPMVLPYVTSKHAVIGMMRSAAKEGAPHKIRVNSVNPSPVDNRMMRSLEEGFAPGQGAAAKENFEKLIPLGRYATNEEVAHQVLFLASDLSAFITGTVNPVDGGLTA